MSDRRRVNTASWSGPAVRPALAIALCAWVFAATRSPAGPVTPSGRPVARPTPAAIAPGAVRGPAVLPAPGAGGPPSPDTPGETARSPSPGAALEAAATPASPNPAPRMELSLVCGDTRLKHAASIQRIVVLPDRRLVAVDSDRVCRFWDSTTGRPSAGMPALTDLADAHLAPDGRRLVAGGFQGLCFVDLATGASSPIGEGTFVDNLALSRTGRRLAVENVSNVLLHDLDALEVGTGDPLMKRQFGGGLSRDGAPSILLGMGFSPGGRLLAVLTCSGLHVWDLRTDSLLASRSLEGVEATFGDPIFSPDGEECLVCGRDALLVLGFPDGRVLRRVPVDTCACPRKAIFAYAPRVGADTVVAGLKRDVTLIDTSTGATRGVLAALSHPATAVSISQDGRLAVVGCQDGALLLLDLDRAGAATAVHAPGGSVRGLAMSPDGATFAASRCGEPVQLRETATGRSLGSVGPVHPHGACVTFSADGSTLLVHSLEHGLSAWSPATRTPARSPSPAAAASPGVGSPALAREPLDLDCDRHAAWADPRTLVICAPDGAQATDLATGGRIAAWSGLESRGLVAPVLTCDGESLAFLVGDRIELVDRKGHRPPAATVRLTGRVTGLETFAVTPSAVGRSSRAYVGFGDGRLTALLGPDGKPLWSRTAHASGICMVVADDAHGHVVTGGQDGTLRVWDATNGELLAEATVPDPPDRPCAAVVSRDGRWIAAGTARGLVLRGRLPARGEGRPHPPRPR